MKIKAKLDRQTGQMKIEYYAIPDKMRFRSHLLQKVLKEAQDQTVLMVDTNQRLTDSSAEDVLTALKNDGLEPLVLPVASNPQKMFGFSYTPRKNKRREMLIMVSLPAGAVPGDGALSALLEYDVAVGIAPNKTLQELGNLLCTGTPLFGSGLFQRDMYDSIVCTAVRSSFDISQLIKDMKDEMGI